MQGYVAGLGDGSLPFSEAGLSSRAGETVPRASGPGAPASPQHGWCAPLSAHPERRRLDRWEIKAED